MYVVPLLFACIHLHFLHHFCLYIAYAKCQVQYLNTNGSWVTVRDFTASGIPKDYITTIPIGTSTNTIRLYGTSSSNYIAVATLRVFG